ncbi:LLM class flavin-dependent oxidoreductase [Streptomyces sp. NPDC002952]|uniref:LLM class flavin-dependent oxidoreductase n=1 Tax=Streptomyces sp. NPDC002952 TaxID=3364673 RepID=UPI0036919866
MPMSGEQLLPFADIVRKGDAERLWTGQSLLIEPHSALAHAAGAGARIPMGTSVTLMPLRHPFQTALQARSLASLTGQPFVAGLGTGPEPFVRSLRGQSYESPLTAVREYATIVRALLAGEVVDLVGEYHAMGGALVPMDTPRVELGLGVLRPRMAELAGELADVAITWLAPPSYLAEVIVPALARGAERANRHRPRVTAVVHVSLDAPGRDHERIVLAASQAHLQAPHYADMLRRAGIEVDPRDLPKTAARLLDSGTAAVGGADDILRTVAAYRAAGADEVVLSAIGIQTVEGTRASLDALGTITAAQRSVR